MYSSCRPRLQAHVALSVAKLASLPPRSSGVGSLLLPVRDAAVVLAYPAHAPVLGDDDRHRSGQRAGEPIGRAVASADVPGPLFGDLLAFEVQRSGHATDVREPAGDHAAEAQELVALAHDHRAVGRRKACDQVGRLEERFVERLYLGVGRRLELFPAYSSQLLLMIGGTVELGEAVEDVYYEVGKTKSGPAVCETVSEVDVGVLTGEISGILQGDEDHRPAVACVAQHAYDALHHALCDPVRKSRLQRRPPLARELTRAVAGELVPLHELLQEPRELARQPFRPTTRPDP